MIKYVLSKFKHGFSAVLFANFLKEISPEFDFPKPDVHLMETLAKFKNYNVDYYKKNNETSYKCIKDFFRTSK